MVDTGIFATTAEVQRKCGARASSTSTAEAYLNDFMTQAESFINVKTRFNWSDVYSTLNADTKAILKLAASNKAAMYAINYDHSGFFTKEVATMFNVLENDFNKAIEILEEIKARDFVNNS